jgi:hypothetical protein
MVGDPKGGPETPFREAKSISLSMPMHCTGGRAAISLL